MGDGRDFWADLRYLVLPVAALTIATGGSIIRFVRAAAIETLRQDFVRTALAKGLTGRQVVLGHVLRNAMIPVVTILALQMGSLFSGALITAQVFAYLGMGKKIGRASCRDRECQYVTISVVAVTLKKTNKQRTTKMYNDTNSN